MNSISILLFFLSAGMSKNGAIKESEIIMDKNARKYKPLNIDNANTIRFTNKASIPIFT